MNHQDWTPVVIKKTKTVVTTKINNKSDNDLDEIEKKTNISLDNRLIIQKARLIHKLSQKQLAQKINVNPIIINEIESGKALYNGQHIGKLKRLLNIKMEKIK